MPLDPDGVSTGWQPIGEVVHEEVAGRRFGVVGAVAAAGGVAVVVVLSVVMAGCLAVAVAKGRWWVVPIVLAAIGSFFVVFTVEPRESFQTTTTFKVIEAGLNLASYGGLATLLFGIGASAKPGSWWDRRHSRAHQGGSL